MTKLKLLATTAILIGTISVSSYAQAEEQSWYQSMTQSVKNWFSPQQDTTPEIKAYLDEVTIAVPPMTGDEASRIEPAAGGDYQPTLQEALESDEHSFNSTPMLDNNGSVAAFEDPISAEDLANIMPAAGDAEGINDESVVVAEEAATQMDAALDNLAEETQEQAGEIEAVVKETVLIKDKTGTEGATSAVEAVTTPEVTTTVETVTEVKGEETSVEGEAEVETETTTETVE